MEGLEDDNGSIPDLFYINDWLKLRAVWTISSMIAASTRHYLLKDIIHDHPTLQSLVLIDADGQGTLCMGREQLCGFRDKPLAASPYSNRTQVSALNIKLRYVPSLELSGGTVIQGAMLVTIRPSDQTIAAKKESEGFIVRDFEGPYRAAAKIKYHHPPSSTGALPSLILEVKLVAPTTPLTNIHMGSTCFPCKGFCYHGSKLHVHRAYGGPTVIMPGTLYVMMYDEINVYSVDNLSYLASDYSSHYVLKFM